MFDQSCVDAWLAEFVDHLRKMFGARLVFVGHHGSWARGEAQAESDIDTLVVLDRIESEDLANYRSVIDRMPLGGQGASGLLCSVPEIQAQLRSELLQYLLRRQSASGQPGRCGRSPHRCRSRRGCAPQGLQQPTRHSTFPALSSRPDEKSSRAVLFLQRMRLRPAGLDLGRKRPLPGA